MTKRSYSDLILLDSFEERFEYLKLGGRVGAETFGSARYLNQAFYTSKEWLLIRDEVIIRDDGCDLGLPDRRIHGPIYVHHLDPITDEELERHAGCLLDMENLVCTSYLTHQAIHYSDINILCLDPLERRPNDTCPWKGGRL